MKKKKKTKSYSQTQIITAILFLSIIFAIYTILKSLDLTYSPTAPTYNDHDNNIVHYDEDNNDPRRRRKSLISSEHQMTTTMMTTEGKEEEKEDDDDDDEDFDVGNGNGNEDDNEDGNGNEDDNEDGNEDGNDNGSDDARKIGNDDDNNKEQEKQEQEQQEIITIKETIGTLSQYNKTIQTNINATTLPSQMKIKYHEMWNHTTNSIHIPDNYKYPFGRTVDDTKKESRKKTSLEILENVLHKKENQKENRQVNDYITNIMMDNENENRLNDLPIPNCLKPNTKHTRKIANEILKSHSHSNPTRPPLSLSYPLFNVGFPKVGSTALNDYLNCIGIKSSHKQLKISKIMNRTKAQQHLFVQRGIQHDPIAIMQLDYNLRNGFFPQIQLLDELHEEYPNSTFIINFRPIQDWIRSTTNWYQMKYRFSLMTNIPGLIMSDEQRLQNNIERDRYYTQLEQEEEEHPQLTNRQRQEKRQEKRAKGRKRKEMNNNKIRTRRLRQQLEGIDEKKDDHYNNNSTSNNYIPLSNIQMARWWCNHIQHIRDYTSKKHYSSHTLIELDLYNTTETSQLLYDLFVSPSNVNNNDNKSNKDYHSCWGHKNKNPTKRKDKNNNKG